MRVSILTAPDSSGAAVVHFVPDNSEERLRIDGAVRRVKQREQDGPWALSWFLIQLTDGFPFAFNVGSEER